MLSDDEDDDAVVAGLDDEVDVVGPDANNADDVAWWRASIIM